MTKEQLDHYLKGGYFTGLYQPNVSTLLEKNKFLIGSTLEFYPCSIISPLLYPEKWKGQFRFNSNKVFGWIPEEDIKDLTIVNSFRSHVPPIRVNIYELQYSTQTQINENFGKNHNLKAPCSVFREYYAECDETVIKLSNPQADAILKCVWKGEALEDMKWTELKL